MYKKISIVLVATHEQPFRHSFVTYGPIEKLSNERDSFRKAREAQIIHKTKTLEPLGINKRDEL